MAAVTSSGARLLAGLAGLPPAPHPASSATVASRTAETSSAGTCPAGVILAMVVALLDRPCPCFPGPVDLGRVERAAAPSGPMVVHPHPSGHRGAERIGLPRFRQPPLPR